MMEGAWSQGIRMRWLAAFSLAASIHGSGVTFAAEPQSVLGRWDATIDSPPFKLGIGEEGYFHPHFFYAVCGTGPAGPRRVIPTAEITMQPTHQLVSEAVTSESYLVARLEGDGSSYDLWAESLNMNEGPSFSFWSPQFIA